MTKKVDKLNLAATNLRVAQVVRSVLTCGLTYAKNAPAPGGWAKTPEQHHDQGYQEAVRDVLSAFQHAGLILYFNISGDAVMRDGECVKGKKQP